MLFKDGIAHISGEDELENTISILHTICLIFRTRFKIILKQNLVQGRIIVLISIRIYQV